MISLGKKPNLKFKVQAHRTGKTEEVPFCELIEGPTLVSVYMRNNTSSCDVQTAELDKNMQAIAKQGFKIISVSRDTCASHTKYAAKHGYKFDDFTPYLYRTDDFGATWTSIVGNLPREPINVVFEDARNPDLLFVGNDTGVFVSITRGTRWVKMNNNMPNVPVHDLLVHPREQDLVVGSYGRGLWITNVGALQDMTEAVLAEDVHLFTIKPAVQRITWAFGANDYLFGQRHLSTPNEPNAMVIRYYLKKQSSGGATVAITDAGGQEIARLQGQAEAGINTVLWTMRLVGGRRGGGAGGRGAGRGGADLDQLVPLGKYSVTLDVGGTTRAEKARITNTQGWSLGLTPQIIR